MSGKAPKGLFVPLVTPFHADESIDYEGYKRVIDYVIEGGMDGVLVGGTTGEYHMMSVEERKELIKKGCEIVGGRVHVMAGTGMNTAKATIELTNYAAECGAEYALVLPPYYHQTTEEGIYEFFREIAAGSKIGIVIYHTPGATNVELSVPLIRRLDEPSMGLAPILVEQIFSIIQDLHRSGSTILLVEQNAQAALNVADRGYVLETGKVVTTGTGQELLENPAIKKAYLGG